jgi:hypothetical protein
MTEPTHDACACAGRWLPYSDALNVWAHADDCPIGAETEAQRRALLVATVLDRARLMLPANRALLAAELADALALPQPGD